MIYTDIYVCPIDNRVILLDILNMNHANCITHNTMLDYNI